MTRAGRAGDPGPRAGRHHGQVTTAPTHALVLAAAVSEARRRQALAQRDLGADVEHFAAHLHGVCETWGVTARGWFYGGAGMPTLDVVCPDSTAAVLKLDAPPALEAAAAVMQASGGHGYARVLAWDPAAGALLTERLGADLWSVHTGLVAQASVVTPLLLQAWQLPLTVARPFVGKAAGLGSILDDLGPRYGTGHVGALRLARSYARELAATEQAEVVCHGDPHGGNVLQRGSGWAMVDPDGFVGERAYDLGVVLRDACREFRAAEDAAVGAGPMMLRDGCAHLSAAAGVEQERVWRWGFVERVTTGLYLGWHGYAAEAETFLRTADEVARAT